MPTIELIAPHQLGDELRHDFHERRLSLASAQENRELRFTAPPDCDEKLTKRLAKYNARVEKFSAAMDDLEAAAGEVALSMSEPTISGKALTDRAQEVRQCRYDLAQQWLALLGQKQPLLAEVVDFFNESIALAEQKLGEVRKAGGKKLRSIGVSPETIPQRNNPTAAEVVFKHRVDELQVVRGAIARVQDLKAKHDRERELYLKIGEDAEIVSRELLTAWHLVVGSL